MFQSLLYACTFQASRVGPVARWPLDHDSAECGYSEFCYLFLSTEDLSAAVRGFRLVCSRGVRLMLPNTKSDHYLYAAVVRTLRLQPPTLWL